MKKSLCLLSVTLIALSSCSKDDKKPDMETPNVENSILPKTKIYTYASNPKDNYTVTYVYDGNKIKSAISDNGSKRIFTYAGNTISKVEQFRKDILQATTTYTYEDNKLKSYLYVYSEGSNSSKARTEYTYNTDKTISVVSVDIDPTTAEETKNPADVLTLDAKGNIAKFAFGGFGKIYEYVYDTKNNPYKNILGYTLMLDTDILDQQGFSNAINNVTKLVTKNKKDEIKATAVFETIYGSNNFLIKNSGSDKDSGTYEYTYY